MISFKEFAKEVVERLEAHVGNRFDFQISEIEKNNHVKKTVLIAGEYWNETSTSLH